MGQWVKAGLISCLFLAVALEPALCSPAPRFGDPVAVLRRWSKLGPQKETKRIIAAEEALQKLGADWNRFEKRRVRIQTAWLDFLGRCQRVADEVAEDPSFLFFDRSIPDRGEVDLRRRVTGALSRRLSEIRPWLIEEVLLQGDRSPVERRTAACEILSADESEEVTSALLSNTLSAPMEVLDAAIAALAGRRRPEVHIRLIELLERADRGKVMLWRWAIEQHFLTFELTEKDEVAVEKIAAYVVPAIRHEDWRIASRAVSVGHCLPNTAVFPSLIRGLEVWIERGADEGRSVRRVKGEILAQLHRRSGRALGPHPDRWTKLWEGNQSGEVKFVGEGVGSERITHAGFFGLRPETDRLLFVLDRSGSMDTAFGDNSSQTCLEEAADQMANYLMRLGPLTQFGVVAFSDSTQVWHKRLRIASEANVERAKGWVLGGGDRAGTQLRAGVLEALHVDRRGKLNLDALEADTIIVLCDGATVEGPGWVAPLMRRIGDEARVVFHAVQIGTDGDGTLEALCSATGGEFVQVEG
jgi:hypothetical protein